MPERSAPLAASSSSATPVSVPGVLVSSTGAGVIVASVGTVRLGTVTGWKPSWANESAYCPTGTAVRR